MSHLYSDTRLLRRLVTQDAILVVPAEVSAPEGSWREVELIFTTGTLDVGLGPMPETLSEDDVRRGAMRGLDDIGAMPKDIGFVGAGMWPGLPSDQGPHCLTLLPHQYVSLRAREGQIEVAVKITFCGGG